MPLKILEKHLQKHGEDLLQLDGWRILRLEQNYSERKSKLVGEAGAPDGLYIRYAHFGFLYINKQLMNTSRDSDAVWEAATEVMWIEWKSPKGRASTAQKIWHGAERKRGALTLIAGEDFPASIEGFVKWYNNSGLMRRVLK
jgi:hypothetical protein